MPESSNPISKTTNQDSFEEIKKFIFLILSKWYWVVLSLSIALVAVWLFLRYEQPVYNVSASFITKKFSENSRVLPTLSEVGAISQRIEVYQQIPILKSEPYIRATLDKVNFDVTYWVEGRVKTSELYGNEKYVVHYVDSAESIPYGVGFQIIEKSNNQYELQTENPSWSKLLESKQFSFNRWYDVSGWRFKAIKKIESLSVVNHAYFFRINSPRLLVNQYRSRLNVNWMEQGSAILNASLSSVLPEKDFDFLNTYLEIVVEKGLEDKNEYLYSVIDFIDGYMQDLSDTILHYQNKLDAFTIKNREYIIGSEGVVKKLNALEEEKNKLLLENTYFDYLVEYINTRNQEESFAPNMKGVGVAPLGELFGEYLEQKWKEKQIELNEQNKRNPLLQKALESDGLVQDNIFESIRNLKAFNNQAVDELDEEFSFYLGSVGELQVEYREYLTVNRLKTLFEDLYNELLARRADAYISIASNTSDYQEVTAPGISGEPVYPNSKKIITLGLLAGLAVPIGLIWLSSKLNPKVVSKDDLDAHSTIPFLGNLGHYSGKGDKALLEEPTSPVSESFRMIRSNIEYMHSDKGKLVLLVTSSISGEGKTFCSVNLAFSYALTNKRTVLIGADMRRPALSKLFNERDTFGLSNYLAGQVTLNEVIKSVDDSPLSIIPSGNIPPNPSELLNGPQLIELLDELKRQYDIIIFDTPPLGLVSDTLQLIKHSTVNIIVVRQGVTYKKSLEAVMELYEGGKLPHCAVVMNDVNFSKYHYGGKYNYGYNYGYGGYYNERKKSKSFLNKIFSRKTRS